MTKSAVGHFPRYEDWALGDANPAKVTYPFCFDTGRFYFGASVGNMSATATGTVRRAMGASWGNRDARRAPARVGAAQPLPARGSGRR